MTSSSYLVTGPVNLQKIIEIAVEMLEGLAQLHAVNVLHLGLKPRNVLLDEYGHAYLSDCGITYARRRFEASSWECTSAAGSPITCEHAHDYACR